MLNKKCYILLIFLLVISFLVSATPRLLDSFNGLGFISPSNSFYNSSASWINTGSNLNYRDYVVAYSNNTLYCNYANTTYSALDFIWYKNDANLSINQSDLSVGNFTRGDLIFCSINGVNSTSRFIIDTTLGDFSNGTYNYLNLTRQSGNITLNTNMNNLIDTLLLMHFDNNYTLNTNITDDVSIYNNNGYCINLTVCPVFNSSGYIGGAFEFDGVDDWFNASFNTPYSTISFWFKNATTNWVYIVNSSNAIYVNGTSVGALPILPINITLNSISIGISPNGIYYKGTLDELLIWNRTLTADEIYRDYLAGLSKIQPSLNDFEHNGTYNSQVFDLGNNANASQISFGYDVPKTSYYYNANLIFYWDGSTNQSYLNSSLQGTAVGGVVIGGANVNGTNKHVIDNNATSFDGVNDYINMGSEFIGANPTTISAWIYPTGPCENGIGKIVTNSQTGGVGIAFSYYSGSTRVVFSESGDSANCGGSGTGSVFFNNWSHVVVTRDVNATNTTISIYVNGVVKLDKVICKFPTTPNTNVLIGNRPNQDYSFNGTIDEVAIWNRVLTGAEVSAMYNASKYGNLKLQTKVSNNITLTGANWSTDYYTANGSVAQIVNLTSPYRYLQYRALFDTLDTNVTPVMTDVAIKQEDYKVRIFNTKPYSNFSFLLPSYNYLWNTTDTTPNFNLTNISDLDGFNDLLFDLEIYNNSGLTNLIRSSYNTTINSTTITNPFTSETTYYYRARLLNNITIYDDVYENRYSDWSITRSFNLFIFGGILDTYSAKPSFFNNTYIRNSIEFYVNVSSLVINEMNLSIYNSSSYTPSSEIINLNQYSWCGYLSKCNITNSTVDISSLPDMKYYLWLNISVGGT